MDHMELRIEGQGAEIVQSEQDIGEGVQSYNRIGTKSSGYQQCAMYFQSLKDFFLSFNFLETMCLKTQKHLT